MSNIIHIIFYLTAGVGIGLLWSIIFYRYLAPIGKYKQGKSLEFSAYSLIYVEVLILLLGGFRFWPILLAAGIVVVARGVYLGDWQTWEPLSDEELARHKRENGLLITFPAFTALMIIEFLLDEGRSKYTPIIVATLGLAIALAWQILQHKNTEKRKRKNDEISRNGVFDSRSWPIKKKKRGLPSEDDQDGGG